MNRVLLLVNHDVVIYNFRLELVQKLLDEGYEVHISCPPGEHTEELKQLGAHFHSIEIDRHGMNPIKELNLLNQYKRLFKAIKPLMVFTYTIKCNIYGGMAARSLNIPFCANITGLGTSVNNGGLKEKFVLPLYKWGLKSAQRVFFQNEENKKYMVERKVVSSPFTVLPGSGVNLNRHVFADYPSSEKPLIICYIGRIMRDKGIDELLEAARVVKNKYSNAVFRIRFKQ